LIVPSGRRTEDWLGVMGRKTEGPGVLIEALAG
jgi:hypothetical protein